MFKNLAASSCRFNLRQSMERLRAKLGNLDIKEIILSSKEAYQKELKNNGVGSQIGKSLFNKFSIKDFPSIFPTDKRNL